jgi:hypothetical protein
MSRFIHWRHMVAAGLLVSSIPSAAAMEFGSNSSSSDDKCRLVSELLDEFNAPVQKRVEPIVMAMPSEARSEFEISTVEDLQDFLSTIDVEIYSEAQLLDLDLRPNRVAVIRLPNDVFQASCG